MLAGNASLQYHSFKLFKQPTVSRRQLDTTPKLQGNFLCLHLEVNMIPNTELSVHPMIICIDLLSVLGCLYSLSDFYNFMLHLLEQLWTDHNFVHWVIPSYSCSALPSIQIFIWTHPQGCLLSILIGKLYQV